MKLTTILVLIAAASGATASPVELQVGLAHARVDGVRGYAASRYLRTSKTDSVSAPFVRASLPVSERMAASVAYSYFGTIKAAGAAPTSDIFDEGGVALTVVTPFQSSEKIHELSFGISYSWQTSERFSVELGPEASLFHSRATIANRSFSEEDLRLGARAGTQYKISEAWSLSLGYRFVAPPSRTLHVFTLALGCGW
jgi:opacity protein-like surface antigen